MEVVLYELSKRNKSSLRPSGEGLVLNLQLKDECFLEHPEFVFDFEPTNYNYCYIPAWNRYYFKGSQQYFHGRWFVNFDEDYLATWLTDIRNTRSFVMYDINSYDITDKRIPTIAHPSIQINNALFRSDIAHTSTREGTYVIVSTGGNGVEVHTFSDSNKLSGLLTDLDHWLDTLNEAVKDPVDAISVFFKQMIGTSDVPSNIRSVIFLPFIIGGDENHRIKLGLYDTGIDAYKWDYDDILIEKTTTVSIPWQINDWRRNPPYTDFYVYIPFVGLINYPTSEITNETNITIKSVLNITTGEMSILVSSGSVILGTYGTNVASQIPIGSSGISIPQLTTGIVKGALAVGGAIASGGASIPSTMGAIVAGSESVLGGLDPISSTMGGLGGGTGAKLGHDILCITAYHDTLVEPSSVVDIIGAPSMFVKSLADASGFIQTAGFQLGGIATAPEKDAVNALMDSGVYLE